MALSIAALGVVFGDIGTSPLYAFDLAMKAGGALPLETTVLGVLSLIFWTLTITVTTKYIVFVLAADNHGEGGILALVTRMRLQRSEKSIDTILLMVGIVGAALIFSDGLLTPAISVLSAVEGLEVVAPRLEHAVIPVSVAILVGLFVSQRAGTARIGGLFGPIMLLWFIVCGVLGARAIFSHPSILAALSPAHAANLLLAYPHNAVAIAGGVFLAVTGAEALYADLGHFGRQAIQRSWLLIAMPALLLNYFGQGAHTLAMGQTPKNPFFGLAPAWFGVPLLILATVATVIASQAVLTGAFSLAKQAIELGLLPRMRIRYTSAINERHVHLPAVNLLLGVGAVSVVVAFGSSAALGGAYGLAVAGAMLGTTVLFAANQLRAPTWPMAILAACVSVFLLVDLFFFSTNLFKLEEGGWLPLAIAAGLSLVMLSWRSGLRTVVAKQISLAESVGTTLSRFTGACSTPCQQTVVFLTRVPAAAPVSMSRLVRALPIRRCPFIIAHVRIASRPWVPPANRLVVTRLDDAAWRVEIRFGYLEPTNVPKALSGVFEIAPELPRAITYVIGSEGIIAPRRLRRPRDVMFNIFAVLSHNATRSVDWYELPSDRTLEIRHSIRL